MADIFDWSSTPADNVTIDGIGTNTGMSPANVDNALRSLAAAIRNTFAFALKAFLNGTAPLPQANGGTGGTDAPSARAALGALSSDYNCVIITDKSAAFSPANNESGFGYNYTGPVAAVTLNPIASVPMTRGVTFVIRNGGTGALTITRGSGVTLMVNGGTTSVDATLAIGGVACLTMWGADFWTVNGTGLS